MSLTLYSPVGAENNTFGIKGVKEHAHFLKEVTDAEKIRSKLMDCESSSSGPNNSMLTFCDRHRDCQLCGTARV